MRCDFYNNHKTGVYYVSVTAAVTEWLAAFLYHCCIQCAYYDRGYLVDWGDDSGGNCGATPSVSTDFCAMDLYNLYCVCSGEAFSEQDLSLGTA